MLVFLFLFFLRAFVGRVGAAVGRERESERDKRWGEGNCLWQDLRFARVRIRMICGFNGAYV